MHAKGEFIAYIAGARWPFWNLACRSYILHKCDDFIRFLVSDNMYLDTLFVIVSHVFAKISHK